VVSASAYAQLKRHRMSTQLVSSYSPALGLRVPPSFAENGLEGLLEEAEAVGRSWRERLEGRAAEYMLTNAHRRTVVVRMNAREMYHFARLRLDSHAQWDIRKLAGTMVDLASAAAPLTMAAAGARGPVEA
ncbi:MAG: FAD-dependent thymidylate synthase, partial [Candidatus Fermentibacterota bacterium]